MYCILALSGCVTGISENVEFLWEQGEFSEAYRMLLQERRTIYAAQDELLYHLDAGLIAHAAKDYRASIEHLETAERLIEEHYTKSLTAEIGTFLANDTVRPYRGEDYEDVYLNIFLALNHYHLGDIERMMVELRRADIKLRTLSNKYEQPLQRAQSGIHRDYAPVVMRFTNSALVRYISLLGYRALGKPDDMRLDFELLQDAFKTQPFVYPFRVPSTIEQEVSVPPHSGRLNFIVFTGRGPEKFQTTQRLLIDDYHYIKIALPEIRPRYSMVERVRITLSDGRSMYLEPIEQMDAVAQETFRLHLALIEAKTVARALAKSTVSLIADAASEQTEGKTSDWLSFAAMFFQLFQEVSEQADVRIARYLPGQAWVGGIDVPYGRVSANVQFLDWKQNVIESQTVVKNVERSDKLNIIEAFSQR
jgi:hypothetical protein